MPQHITIRVPWHDHGWDGTVCQNPANNTSCLRLKNIFENKDDSAECELCGKCMAGIEDQLPCINEGVAFMSPEEHHKIVVHPYKKSSPDTHGHFLDTDVTYPPYSLPGRPYYWMLKNNIIGSDDNESLMDTYGIRFDEACEPALSWNTGWVQEASNQRAIFDSFYRDVIPEKSLVVIYAKQVPFSEDTRRVVIGMGLVEDVIPAVEHNHTNEGKLRSMTWETMIKHSIRPDHKDGFLIPYREMMEYAKEHEGFDMSSVVVYNPDDAFSEFSYATEHVSYDSMIDVIQSCIKSFGIINKALGGYGDVLNWLNARLAEVWEDRGAYPGLGTMLCAMKMPLGVVIAKQIQESYDDKNGDFWDYVDSVIDDPVKYIDKDLASGISNILKLTWKKMPEERKTLFKLLSRFSFSLDQSDVIFNTENRLANNIDCIDKEIIENPYILYEKTRILAADLVVSIRKVDRAVFPIAAIREKYHVPEPTALDSDNDWRRVRAMAVYILEHATESGHTILPCNQLIQGIREMIIEPACNVTQDILDAIDGNLRQEIMRREMKNGTEYYKLNRMNEYDEVIEKRINKRKDAEKINIQADWRKELDEKLKDQHIDNMDETEERARTEKAAVLKVLAESRISVLVGDAGTGKTTVLATLCSNETIKAGGVLLLAPTGKATVRLMESMGEMAKEFDSMNVAQFLSRNGGFNWDSMRYQLCTVTKTTPYKTVIVDEASMLTEEMMGSLLSALNSAERIIFVGDPNQLPPIGAGRPFVDLVYLLSENMERDVFPVVTKGYGQLTVNRRQQSSDNERMDVELSKLFTNAEEVPDVDVITEIKLGKQENIRFEHWETREELEEKLIQILVEELKMDGPDDKEGFDKSLGATVSGNYRYFNHGIAKNADKWQILAPVRNDAQGVVNLNHLIHQRYREDILEVAKFTGYNKKIAKPFGPEGIVYGDKVINIKNQGKAQGKIAYPKGGRDYIANGEIGIACGSFGKQSKYLNVEFSSQPDYSYSYTDKEFGEESDISLELAYALTVHKSQGSQFNTVILVVAEPCRILSREMLYTALTRQKDKIIILYNKDAVDILKYANEAYSNISQRYTDLFADKNADFKPNIVEVSGKFYEEKLVHKTARGEMVRSKSEVIIADALYHNGIEYQYEPDLVLEGRLKKPDFMIQDNDTGITWYWEHCGMMTDPQYAKRWEDKKAFYKKNGIEEGKNLIVTYDENGSIDSSKIEEIIKKNLI